jgi:predicted nucleic acid-binding protein
MMWDGFTGDSIYLDTNIVILAIEEGNAWLDVLRSLFEAIDERAIRSVTSELTLAEVLAKPLSLGDQELIDKYDRLLAPDSPLNTMPIDRSVLRVAAQFQSQFGIKLMDSIHVATAHLTKCEFFLTQDQRLGRTIGESFRWIQLSEVSGRS